MDQSLQVKILKELMHQLDEGRNIDAGVQYSMPTTAYVCPDIAAREWDQFFQQHPQLIGLSDDLPEPGSFLTTEDFGTPVLATRDKDGTFHAFLNACRHRSVKVASSPRGQKSVFMCPFHNWSYANTGDLISIPNEDHFGTVDKSCNGLIELPAVERDGLLWVHPQPDGQLDIDELLGELAAEIGSFNLGALKATGDKTIDMQLNWKLANDTFGETYHFGKLHKDTLGRLYYGNNQHLQEFGRHHRFVTANRGIDALRTQPETEWRVTYGTFVMYYLFPNIQLVVNSDSITLIRIYPDPKNPSRSITRIGFYFEPQIAAAILSAPDLSNSDAASESGGRPHAEVYNYQGRGADDPATRLASSLEVFRSTIEMEDYAMGEMQQLAAADGTLKEIQFGRNEPALHHFHTSYREALGMPPLEKIESWQEQ